MRQITIDFKKVQWATYHWINGKGDERKTKPDYFTANGTPIINGDKAYPYLPEYPSESTLERAKRLDILDVWKPVCQLHITANRTLTFTGNRATQIWKAYNAHIYGKRN